MRSRIRMESARGGSRCFPCPSLSAERRSPGARGLQPSPQVPGRQTLLSTRQVSTCAVGPAVAVSPGNFLEMQILRPCPCLLNHRLGVGPAVCLPNPPGDSDATLVFRITATALWNLGCSNPCKLKHFPRLRL